MSFLRRKAISSRRRNAGRAGRRGDGEVRMEEPGECLDHERRAGPNGNSFVSLLEKP